MIVWRNVWIQGDCFGWLISAGPFGTLFAYKIYRTIIGSLGSTGLPISFYFSYLLDDFVEGEIKPMQSTVLEESACMIKITIQSMNEATNQISFLVGEPGLVTRAILDSQTFCKGIKSLVISNFHQIHTIVNGGSRCLWWRMLHEDEVVDHPHTFIFEYFVINEGAQCITTDAEPQ